MRVRVLFFASLRERAGIREETLDVVDGSTVATLWSAVRRERPRLAEFAGSVSFAVNREYVDSEKTLQDNDEVAFIPPVSGGSEAGNV